MSSQINKDIAPIILENAPFGIVVFNREFEIRYLNKAIESITGFSSEEILKQNNLDLFLLDEKYQKIVKQKLEKCIEKSFNDQDIKITKKAGTIIPIQIAGFPVILNDDISLVLVLQDVTSKKAFDRVLESSFDNFIQTTIDLDQALKKIKEQRAKLEEYQVNMKRELMVAKTVQKSIIPKKFFSDERVRVWGVTKPSEELGGDYYDYFHFDKTKLGILIADVSGHGVPSSLITAMIKVYFEKYAKEFVEAEKVFTYVNNEITRTLQDTGFYFTSFYSVIDLDTMLISSACAGHDYAICYEPSTDTFYELGKTEKGTIIGSFEEAEFDSSSHQLTKGSRVLYFTDGITEARNRAGDFYGLDRVKDFMRKHPKLEAKEFIEKILEDIDAFYEGIKPNDDRTIIAVDIVALPNIEKMSEHDLQQIVDTAFRNGRKYIKQRQYSAAINEFEKILQFDKGSSGAYSYLGQISGIFGDFVKAEEFLNRSIELNPSYVQGFYFLGIILFKQKKYRAAKECWTKLKQIAGDFKNVNRYMEKINKLGL